MKADTTTKEKEKTMTTMTTIELKTMQIRRQVDSHEMNRNNNRKKAEVVSQRRSASMAGSDEGRMATPSEVLPFH